MRKKWSNKDEELLIKVYKNYTNEEIVYLFFGDVTTKGLMDKASRLKCIGKSQSATQRINEQRANKSSLNSVGKSLSEESRKKISESKKEYYKNNECKLKGKKWEIDDKRRKILSELRTGVWDGENNPRHKNPLNGELNGRWKGGILPIYLELRTQVDEWKTKSMENCNYKCVITGGEFDNVHHLYPFRDIVDEVFKNTKIEVKQLVMDYTKEEFTTIVNELNRLHFNYGLGVCLNKEIHKLFHDTYGYTKNTNKQFYDFVERLKNNEFDEYIKDIGLDISYVLNI